MVNLQSIQCGSVIRVPFHPEQKIQALREIQRARGHCVSAAGRPNSLCDRALVRSAATAHTRQLRNALAPDNHINDVEEMLPRMWRTLASCWERVDYDVQENS
jgi:hypothetical protein